VEEAKETLKKANGAAAEEAAEERLAAAKVALKEARSERDRISDARAGGGAP
jgi:hypothetical protein